MLPNTPAPDAKARAAALAAFLFLAAVACLSIALVAPPRAVPEDAPPCLRVSYAAPPPEGIELLLEIRDTSPLRLVLEDISYELPEVPGQTFTPRPMHMMPVPSFRSSDTTIVRRKFDLDARAGITLADF